MNMGTELTRLLEEISDSTWGDLSARDSKKLNRCIELSQQPPVYAMCACGDKIMPNSDAVCGNCAAAPSPQAVTVDKVIEVVRQWAGGHFHTDNNKQLYNDLRTRLDQYLNNR